MDARDEQLAHNQNIFRAGNEAIRSNIGPDVAGIVLICECPDAECLERIGVRHEEYEQVRANPRATRTRWSSTRTTGSSSSSAWRRPDGSRRS